MKTSRRIENCCIEHYIFVKFLCNLVVEFNWKTEKIVCCCHLNGMQNEHQFEIVNQSERGLHSQNMQILSNYSSKITLIIILDLLLYFSAIISFFFPFIFLFSVNIFKRFNFTDRFGSFWLVYWCNVPLLVHYTKFLFLLVASLILTGSIII